MSDLLDDAARRAKGYLEGLGARPVAPAKAAVDALSALDRPLPSESSAPG
jgi:hypothetical protein